MLLFELQKGGFDPRNPPMGAPLHELVPAKIIAKLFKINMPGIDREQNVTRQANHTFSMRM